MKPLSSTALPGLSERFSHGEGAELRHILPKGPTTIELTFSLQDKNRGFDWIDLAFEISGVTDARLVDDHQFGMLDMEDGFTILFEAGRAAFGVGRYDHLDPLMAASLFVIGDSIKYEERPFAS